MKSSMSRILIPAFIVILATLLLAGLVAHPAQARSAVTTNATSILSEDGWINQRQTPTSPSSVDDTITLQLFDPEYGSCGNVSINGYVGTSQGNVTRLMWDWGDGTPVNHSWFPATHKYASNGAYTVTVTAYADWGGTRTETKRVQISNASCNNSELGLYVLTRNEGLVRVSFSGEKDTLVPNCYGYSFEILDKKIYCNGIRVYDLQGSFLDSISIPSNTSYVTFVAIPDGRIALLDNQHDKAYFIDSSGNLLTTVNLLDSPDTQWQNLDGIVVGNKLILSEDGYNHLLQIDLDTYERSIFKDLSSLHHRLSDIAYANGTYYVCGPDKIYKFSSPTRDDLELVAQLPENNITGIVVHGEYAYVTVNFPNKVYKVNLRTGESQVFATGLDRPSDIEMVLDHEFMPLWLKH